MEQSEHFVLYYMALSGSQLEQVTSLIIPMKLPQITDPHVELILRQLFSVDVDAILKVFVTNGKWRIEEPSLCTIELMRNVIIKYSSKGNPIPVLIAASPCKLPPFCTFPGRPDLAEVFMLKRLKSIQKQVQRYYDPGITIRIRLEDLTIPAVLDNKLDTVIMQNYIDTLQKLVQVWSTLSN